MRWACHPRRFLTHHNFLCLQVLQLPALIENRSYVCGGITSQASGPASTRDSIQLLTFLLCKCLSPCVSQLEDLRLCSIRASSRSIPSRRVKIKWHQHWQFPSVRHSPVQHSACFFARESPSVRGSRVIISSASSAAAAVKN